jgi:NADH-quinone oxidoreductase subunit N
MTLLQASVQAPAIPQDLSAISRTAAWYLNYSLNHFWPETILVIGFLVAIVIDLVERRTSRHHVTAIFSICILAAAGVAAWQQWTPFVAQQAWAGGTPVFPYSQSLFAPHVQRGVMLDGYGMAVVDNFAVFFKLLVAAAGILVLLMSMTSKELALRSRHFGEYSTLILGMSVGMFIMPAATDLLTMYISLELVSIAGYILAGFSKHRSRSAEAALKYFLFGAISSGVMIYGFSLLYGMTGSTQILAIRQVLALSATNHTIVNHQTLWLATGLIMMGMAYKISAVPFHFWTPDVYEGSPTAVTALLSVASKAAGFGLLMRFVLFTFPIAKVDSLPVIDWQIMLAVLSAVTMTFGNLAAFLQTNVKRMLAYSSIAHAGYMLAGIAVAGPQGIVAVMIYLATYVFMNLGAFYAVMLIEDSIGTEDLDDFRALARRAPLPAAALSICLVSLTGIPLTAGFIGKFYLFSAILTPVAAGTAHQPMWLWLALVGIVNTLLSLYYYLRVIGAMYLKRSVRELALERAHLEIVEEPRLRYPLFAQVLIFAFIAPVILLGIYFQPLVDFASGVIRFFTFDNITF